MAGRVIAIIASVVGGIALLVYGSFAIYEGSWALTKSATQHSLEIQKQQANGQAQNTVTGWNFQSALGQRITLGIANVYHDSTDITTATQDGDTTYADDLKSQRQEDANTVCQQAAEVNATLPVDKPQTKWINTNCLAGTVNPSSPYYYSGN